MAGKLRKVALGLAVLSASTLLSFSIDLPAHASGTNCSTAFVTLPNGTATYPQVCMAVNGGGTYVNSMTASVTNNGVQFDGHIQLYGPDPAISGSLNGGDQNLGYQQVSWSPGRNVSGGDYCARLWYYHNGIYDNVGTACLDVH